MATGSIPQPYPSDAVKLWKYTGLNNESDVFTLSNSLRAVLMIVDASNDNKMFCLLSTSSSGTVTPENIYLGSGLTLTTSTKNQLTVAHGGQLTYFAIILRGSISV